MVEKRRTYLSAVWRGKKKMKKYGMILLMLLGLTVMLTACGGKKKAESPEVQKGIDALTAEWEEIYRDGMYEGDKHLEIRNARVVYINPDTEIAEFQDVDYIVEFILFTDYFGSGPYYENVGVYDSVKVYKDGTVSVEAINPLSVYRAINYITDFSDIIESISDYGNAYNQTIQLQ